MTATPRLYSDTSKSKAAQSDAALYGEEMYRIGFGETVQRDLLTDYKVLILTVNEHDIPPAVQQVFANQEHEIKADDQVKLIDCMNALSKQMLGDAVVLQSSDAEPMLRAVEDLTSQPIAPENR